MGQLGIKLGIASDYLRAAHFGGSRSGNPNRMDVTLEEPSLILHPISSGESSAGKMDDPWPARLRQEETQNDNRGRGIGWWVGGWVVGGWVAGYRNSLVQVAASDSAAEPRPSTG